jgi:ribosomal protein L40E
VPDEQLGEVCSLAEYGDAPFRICVKCGAHNNPDAVLCQACRGVLKHTFFPRKGGARIVAILLLLLLVLMFAAFCYAIYTGI